MSLSDHQFYQKLHYIYIYIHTYLHIYIYTHICIIYIVYIYILYIFLFCHGFGHLPIRSLFEAFKFHRRLQGQRRAPPYTAAATRAARYSALEADVALVVTAPAMPKDVQYHCPKAATFLHQI